MNPILLVLGLNWKGCCSTELLHCKLDCLIRAVTVLVMIVPSSCSSTSHPRSSFLNAEHEYVCVCLCVSICGQYVWVLRVFFLEGCSLSVALQPNDCNLCFFYFHIAFQTFKVTYSDCCTLPLILALTLKTLN